MKTMTTIALSAVIASFTAAADNTELTKQLHLMIDAQTAQLNAAVHEQARMALHTSVIQIQARQLIPTSTRITKVRSGNVNHNQQAD